MINICDIMLRIKKAKSKKEVTYNGSTKEKTVSFKN